MKKSSWWDSRIVRCKEVWERISGRVKASVKCKKAALCARDCYSENVCLASKASIWQWCKVDVCGCEVEGWKSFWEESKVGNSEEGLDEPFLLLCNVMAGGWVDNCVVWVHGVVRSLVFLCQIFALMTRLVSVDQNGHDDQQQENDQQ